MPSLDIKLKPFSVPNFVISEGVDGITERRTFPLSDVDAHALAVMCNEYRAEIFRKAGKSDPQPSTQGTNR